MTDRAKSVLSASALSLAAIALTLVPTGYSFMTLSVCAVCLATVKLLLCLPARGASPESSAGLGPVERVAVIALVFVFLSLLPLPAPLTRITGSGRHAQNTLAANAVSEAGNTGLVPAGTQPLFSATRNKAGTLRVLTLLAACFSALSLASRLTPPHRRRMLTVLVWTGAALAAAGIVSLYWRHQGDTLWWKLPVSHALPPPIACFRNRNHFAALLAALLPPAIALTVENTYGKRPFSAVLSAVPAFVMAAAVAVSGSRGGWVACLAGMVFLAFGLLTVRRAIAGIAMIFLACAFVGTILSAPSNYLHDRVADLRRMEKSDSYITRTSAWRDSLRIWKAYPFLGVGANGFRATYPQFRTTSESSFMTHPENEYVQLLVDGGLAGVMIALMLAAAFAYLAKRSLPSAAIQPTLVVALCATMASVLTTAAIDFAMHIPLYAVVVVTLLGLLLSPVPEPAMPRFAFGASVLILAAAVAAGIWSAGRVRRDDPVWMSKAGPDELASALAWSPTSSYAWYYLGRKAWGRLDADGTAFGEKCLSRAVAYDPNNYRIWRELALLRAGMGDSKGAEAAARRVRDLRAWVHVALPAGIEQEQ